MSNTGIEARLTGNWHAAFQSQKYGGFMEFGTVSYATSLDGVYRRPSSPAERWYSLSVPATVFKPIS